MSKTDFHETIKYSDTNLYLWTCRPLHDKLLGGKAHREDCKEGLHSCKFAHAS